MTTNVPTRPHAVPAVSIEDSGDGPLPTIGPVDRGRTTRRRGNPLPYLLVAPAALLLLAVVIVPVLGGIAMSALRLDQFTIRRVLTAPFAGLANFATVLTPGPAAEALLQSVLVTGLYTVLVVGGAGGLGMTAATLLNRSGRFNAMLRTFFLVPFALPVYVTVIGWTFVLQRDSGSLNALLVDTLQVTEDRPFWLLGDNAFWSLVVISIWRVWPFAFLMLLAGLQGIPIQLYEAASLDGASAALKFRHITLPLLRPVNAVLLLVLFLWTFNEFNIPYTLFGQVAPESANLLSLHIYVNSFVNWQFGLGAAMSVLLAAGLLVAVGLYLAALSRKEPSRA
jgi:multiple sugar transport system permease protein